jgi:hypothetical protein
MAFVSPRYLRSFRSGYTLACEQTLRDEGSKGSSYSRMWDLILVVLKDAETEVNILVGILLITR